MNGNHLMSFPCNSFRIFTLFIWWFNTINDIYFTVLPFSRNLSVSTLWIFLFKDQEKWNADWNLMFSNMQMDRLPLNNFQVLLLLADVVGISYFLFEFFFYFSILSSQERMCCYLRNTLLHTKHYANKNIISNNFRKVFLKSIFVFIVLKDTFSKTWHIREFRVSFQMIYSFRFRLTQQFHKVETRKISILAEDKNLFNIVLIV